jgi:hypothetical protein
VVAVRQEEARHLRRGRDRAVAVGCDPQTGPRLVDEVVDDEAVAGGRLQHLDADARRRLGPVAERLLERREARVTERLPVGARLHRGEGLGLALAGVGAALAGVGPDHLGQRLRPRVVGREDGRVHVRQVGGDEGQGGDGEQGAHRCRGGVVRNWCCRVVVNRPSAPSFV